MPVVVKDLTDSQVHEVMLIENLQRSQLQPLEEAQSLEVLLQEDITQEQLAKKLGKSQSWIANRLRLLQAPDELIYLLISRKITPKHVITLLPYVEYPVFDDIMDNCKPFEGRSVSALSAVINNTIMHGSAAVLHIDRLPWDYRNYDIDVSVCDGCSDIYDQSSSDDKDRHCMNRDCWCDMVKKAKAVYKSKNAESVPDGCIDTSDLDHNSYSYIGPYNFDMSDCESCDDCAQDMTFSKICLNPSCHKKKRDVFSRERDAVIKVKQKRVDDAITKWTAGKSVLLNADLRMIMCAFVDSMYCDEAGNALGPWYQYEDDFEEDDAVNSVPDEDLNTAVMRLIVYDGLGHGDIEEELKDKFPDVAGFLDQKTLDDYVAPEVPA